MYFDFSENCSFTKYGLVTLGKYDFKYFPFLFKIFKHPFKYKKRINFGTPNLIIGTFGFFLQWNVQMKLQNFAMNSDIKLQKKKISIDTRNETGFFSA